MTNVIWKMGNETRLSEFGLMRQRKGEEGIFAGEAEFAADVGAVVLDGADADAQGLGDLLIAPGLGDQLQDAEFGIRQVFDRWGLPLEFFNALAAGEKMAGKHRAEEVVSGGDR